MIQVDFSEGFNLQNASPEELVKEARRLTIDSTCITDRKRAFDAVCMADTLSAIATAEMMAEQHICDHGVRGWCPHCHQLMKNGMTP